MLIPSSRQPLAAALPIAEHGIVSARTETIRPPLRVVSDEGLSTRRSSVNGPAGQVATQQGLVPFDLIGLAFQSASHGVAVLRTLKTAGWTDWVETEQGDRDGPDPVAAQASQTEPATLATNPIWVGEATGFDVRFPADATDVAVHLVRDIANPAGELAVKAANDSVGTSAAPIWPMGMHARSEWGARAFKIHPGMGNPLKGVQMVVIHHTAQANDYTQAEVPAVVRGLQAYDMDVRHYDDLGYNVMVDRFGGIWEGRGGGLDQAVVGAHALGMNQVATGISIMGNFVDVDPPAEVIDAIAKVAGWKLALDGYDPLSSVTIGAEQDQGHPAHPLPLTTPRIVGHRDVGQTECPGRIWNYLPTIRIKAAAYARVASGTLDPLHQPRPKAVSVSGETSPTSGAGPSVVVQVDHLAVATLPSKRRDLLAASSRSTFQAEVAVAAGPHRICAFETGADGTRALLGCHEFTVVDPNVNPLRPVRMLDTRVDPTLRLKARVQQAVTIAGQKSVPAEADSVAANLTVTNTANAGYLRVVPCDAASTDQTSNVNFAKGQTIPALVLTKLGPNGQLCLFADTDLDVIIDVTAWFPVGGGFNGMTPSRLLDTRLPAAPLSVATERRVQVAGRGGVPANATAAALNIVATRPKYAGWLAVYPCDSGFSGTSNLNFRAGQTIANLAVTKLAADGSVCLRSDQTLDAIVDVTGWFTPGAFHPIAPRRIMDTRQGLGTTRISFEDTIELKILGQPTIPPEATSVFVNLTVTNPEKAGYLTVYPCAQVHPGTSNLNFAAGETIPNLTLTRIGINGCVRVDSGSNTDVIADAVGYFV